MSCVLRVARPPNCAPHVFTPSVIRDNSRRRALSGGDDRALAARAPLLPVRGAARLALWLSLALLLDSPAGRRVAVAVHLSAAAGAACLPPAASCPQGPPTACRLLVTRRCHLPVAARRWPLPAAAGRRLPPIASTPTVLHADVSARLHISSNATTRARQVLPTADCMNKVKCTFTYDGEVDASGRPVPPPPFEFARRPPETAETYKIAEVGHHSCAGVALRRVRSSRLLAVPSMVSVASLLQHGWGAWSDSAPRGECMHGFWEVGLPVGPFRASEYGSDYVMASVRIGFAHNRAERCAAPCESRAVTSSATSITHSTTPLLHRGDTVVTLPHP